MTSLLVLGGTQFLGRAVAEDALQRGYEVTVLHRGHNEPPAGVTALQGDRMTSDGLRALGDRAWDIVVDTWSGNPSAVERSTDLLRDRADRYAYVSSRSVYTWPAAAGADEGAPVVQVPDDVELDYAELDYAESKRAAELAVDSAFGARSLLLRAGLLIGPRENTGRLPWWLRRIARGGDVPVPGPRDLDMQYIDARDLAAWMLDAVLRGAHGAFNAVGPPGCVTMGELLDVCVRVTGASATLRWVDPVAILSAGVQPWTELPAWMPPGPDHDAVHRGDVSKAQRHGLSMRPLYATVADTWTWMCSAEGALALKDQASGLSAATEEALLKTL